MVAMLRFLGPQKRLLLDMFLRSPCLKLRKSYRNKSNQMQTEDIIGDLFRESGLEKNFLLESHICLNEHTASSNPLWSHRYKNNKMA